MIPGRTKGSLARFFRDQGPQWCRQVEIVRERTASRSYQAAIAQYLPAARHVLDRFHVVRWFTQGLTLVRQRAAAPRPPPASPNVRAGPVFRARFTLLRRADHLTEAHQAHLDRLFRCSSPSPHRVGRPLQELYQPYRGRRPRRGRPSRPGPPDGSPTSTPRDRSPEYHQVVDTIITWGEQILAYHTTRRRCYPTDPSKGSTTSYKSYAASPTASPTTTITPPEESS